MRLGQRCADINKGFCSFPTNAEGCQALRAAGSSGTSRTERVDAQDQVWDTGHPPRAAIHSTQVAQSLDPAACTCKVMAPTLEDGACHPSCTPRPCEARSSPGEASTTQGLRGPSSQEARQPGMLGCEPGVPSLTHAPAACLTVSESQRLRLMTRVRKQAEQLAQRGWAWRPWA